MIQIKDEWQEVDALSLKVGQQFQIPEDDEDCNPFLGETFTVIDIIRDFIRSGEILSVETDSQDFNFEESDRVLVQKDNSNG